MVRGSSRRRLRRRTGPRVTPVTRPAPPTAGRTVTPVRALAETFTVTARNVSRFQPYAPLRSPDPPHGPSHSEVLRAWEELDWWSCAYCDAPFGPKVVCEVDHVVPLAEGGPHELWNLAPSCTECNRGKSDSPVEVWLTCLAGRCDDTAKPQGH
ncbi:HNH endonuclease [Streptomyces sparsogenes]|uniref:HNH endonuclease n=1 Tax=Streptomyces sparsogenes TaxID=67365 RepID=UPI0033E3B64A